MNMVVYTCIVGKDTDPLRPPRVCERGVRFLCFTDSEELRERVNRGGWGWEALLVPPTLNPGLRSREIKILAHKLFPGVEHSLWLDAAYELHTSPSSLLNLLNGNDFVAMRHPHRNRITDEAEAIIRLKLAPEDKVRRQLAIYRNAGFDTDEKPQSAITSTGFLLRKHGPQVKAFENAWWKEVSTHTYRDQMSIDFVLSQIGLKVAYIPGHYRNNPYAKWHASSPKRNKVNGVPRSPNPNVRPPRSLRVVRTLGL